MLESGGSIPASTYVDYLLDLTPKTGSWTDADLAYGKAFHGATGATWSPDGTWFAFVDATYGLRMMNLDGQSKIVLPTAAGLQIIPWQATWSPDGQFLAVLARNSESAEDSIVVVRISDRNVAEAPGQ